MSKRIEPIQMRIGGIKHTCKCTACGKSSSKETKEFYDMKIGDDLIIHLCYDCMDLMFIKTLKATVQYQGKLKAPNKNIRR